MALKKIRAVLYDSKGGPEISATRFSDVCHFLWGEGRQAALSRAQNNETKMFHR